MWLDALRFRREKHPMVVEFVGLPGSGKSTVFHTLNKQLRGSGFGVTDLSHIVDKIQKNTGLKLLITLWAIIVNLKLSLIVGYEFWLKRRGDLNALLQVAYLIRLLYLLDSKWLHRLSRGSEFIISDQFVIQSCASIALCNKEGVSIDITNFLMRQIETKLGMVVLVECDEYLSLERVRARNNGRTRFDFWDDKTAIQKLRNMTSVFNVFKKSINEHSIQYIEIQAVDSIDVKVAKIIKGLKMNRL